VASPGSYCVSTTEWQRIKPRRACARLSRVSDDSFIHQDQTVKAGKPRKKEPSSPQQAG